ncbi:hypothetical protein Msi02_46850 [Microbispora siamensis]|uniref:Uncharacterized protein n=1 Tax=Microbispora siamensis TaxID=564413 RepID=A0ABQ4GR12_9ACTN|nr:hypothetical protein Msi02_46850 [Microbispora siamensis]
MPGPDRDHDIGSKIDGRTVVQIVTRDLDRQPVGYIDAKVVAQHLDGELRPVPEQQVERVMQGGRHDTQSYQTITQSSINLLRQR